MSDLEQRVEALEEVVGRILEALDLATEPESEDPLAAGFARFMNRPREERHGER